MLTGEITEVDYEATGEKPTFGVVNDGRTYPAVVARKRQHNGSARETLYTVSKNGKNRALYDQFYAEVIEPYYARQRERQNRSQHPDGNTSRPAGSRNRKKGNTSTKRVSAFTF